jgi:hypothetical protein
MARRSSILLNVLDSQVRIELDTAERFFRLSELRFQHERDKLERQCKKHPKSYWNKYMGHGVTLGDLLDDEFVEVREMQRLNRYFGVILVYSTFERILQRIYKEAKRLGDIKNKRASARPYLDFKGYVKVFKKDLGIDLTARSAEYAALNKLRVIRNVIAHDAGWTRENLKQYGFEKHQQIELNEKYFFEVMELARTEGAFIIDSYRNFLLGTESS